MPGRLVRGVVGAGDAQAVVAASAGSHDRSFGAEDFEAPSLGVCANTELLSSTSAPEAIRSSSTDVSSAVTGRRVPSRSVTSLIDVRTSAHMAVGSPNMRHTQSMSRRHLRHRALQLDDSRRHQRPRPVLHPPLGSPWDAIQIAVQTGSANTNSAHTNAQSPPDPASRAVRANGPHTPRAVHVKLRISGSSAPSRSATRRPIRLASATLVVALTQPSTSTRSVRPLHRARAWACTTPGVWRRW